MARPKRGRVHEGFNEATRKGALTPEQEQVLRMRHGLTVAGDEPIGGRELELFAAAKAGPNLRQIEEQVLARMYRDPEGRQADEVVMAAANERHFGSKVRC